MAQVSPETLWPGAVISGTVPLRGRLRGRGQRGRGGGRRGSRIRGAAARRGCRSGAGHGPLGRREQMLADSPAQRAGPRLGSAAGLVQGFGRGAAQIGLRGGEDSVQHLFPLLEAAPPAARAARGAGCPPVPGRWRGGRRGARRARAPAAFALAHHSELQVLPKPGLERGGCRRCGCPLGIGGLHPPPPRAPPPLPSSGSDSCSSTLSGCASSSSRSLGATAKGAAAPARSARRLQASAGAGRRRSAPNAGCGRCLFFPHLPRWPGAAGGLPGRSGESFKLRAPRLQPRWMEESPPQAARPGFPAAPRFQLGSLGAPGTPPGRALPAAPRPYLHPQPLRAAPVIGGGGHLQNGLGSARLTTRSSNHPPPAARWEDGGREPG